MINYVYQYLSGFAPLAALQSGEGGERRSLPSRTPAATYSLNLPHANGAGILKLDALVGRPVSSTRCHVLRHLCAHGVNTLVILCKLQGQTASVEVRAAPERLKRVFGLFLSEKLDKSKAVERRRRKQKAMSAVLD